jgi:hypothetical protein
VQPYVANKSPFPPKFDGKQAKSVLAKVLLDTLDQAIALRGGEALRQEFHNTRVRVQSRKSFAIALCPTPQQKPFGLDHALFPSLAGTR